MIRSHLLSRSRALDPLASPPRRLAYLAPLAACLMACASATAPTVVPSAQPVEVAPSEPTEPATAVQAADEAVAQPAASAAIDVAPARMNLEDLPVADYPPMLLAGNAPSALPSGINPLTRKPPITLSNGGLLGGMLKAGDHPLTRIQLGDLRMSGHAGPLATALCESDITAWRAAGGGPKAAVSPTAPQALSLLSTRYVEPKPSFTGIRPARWETLTRNKAGKVVLTITDAWFDYRTCTASVQQVTTIEPSPVLGGLAYAFRGRCVDCRSQDGVTFVAPNLRTSTGMRVSRGAFSIVHMGAKERVGGTFIGFAEGWALERWDDALQHGNSASKAQRAVLGFELQWDVGRNDHTITMLGARTP